MPTPRSLNLVHIVINEHGPIFFELLELLTHCMQELGVDCSRTTNQLISGRLNVLVGHTIFLPERELRTIREKGGPYVVFQVEALHEAEGFCSQHPHYWKLLENAAQIWDYSTTNCDLLQAKGFGSVYYVPLGYCPALQRISLVPERDIDVVFFGSLTARRMHVMEQLANLGLRAEAHFGTYGQQRDERIARAKIVLNMHQFETAQLEQVRICYLLNNRCFVISERSDVDPYGGAVVFSDYARLSECCLEFLQPGKDSERDRIATNGFESVRKVPTIESLQAAWLEYSVR